MSDSADIKGAADKLNSALQNLEAALDPMLADLSRLRKVESESEGFVADRAKLAQELDESKSREVGFKDREAQFQRLADETTAELDQVIAKVQNVLERD